MNENENINSSSSEIITENQVESTTQSIVTVDNVETIECLEKIHYSIWFLCGVMVSCFIVLMLSQYIKRWK